MTPPSLLRRCLFGASVLILLLLPQPAAAQQWFAATRSAAGDSVMFDVGSIERQPDGSVEVWTRYNNAAKREYSVMREAYTCHGWTRLLYVVRYTLSGTVIKMTDVASISPWERLIPGTLEDDVGYLVCDFIARREQPVR